MLHSSQQKFTSFPIKVNESENNKRHAQKLKLNLFKNVIKELDARRSNEFRAHRKCACPSCAIAEFPSTLRYPFHSLRTQREHPWPHPCSNAASRCRKVIVNVQLLTKQPEESLWRKVKQTKTPFPLLRSFVGACFENLVSLVSDFRTCVLASDAGGCLGTLGVVAGGVTGSILGGRIKGWTDGSTTLEIFSTFGFNYSIFVRYFNHIFVHYYCHIKVGKWNWKWKNGINNELFNCCHSSINIHFLEESWDSCGDSHSSNQIYLYFYSITQIFFENSHFSLRQNICRLNGR